MAMLHYVASFDKRQDAQALFSELYFPPDLPKRARRQCLGKPPPAPPPTKTGLKRWRSSMGTGRDNVQSHFLNHGR